MSTEFSSSTSKSCVDPVDKYVLKVLLVKRDQPCPNKFSIFWRQDDLISREMSSNVDYRLINFKIAEPKGFSRCFEGPQISLLT